MLDIQIEYIEWSAIANIRLSRIAYIHEKKLVLTVFPYKFLPASERFQFMRNFVRNAEQISDVAWTPILKTNSIQGICN